ncbi:MAG: hypothetical protein IT252_04310 [Chitinophagaceae bacterium]|nr:hypothetical protein [Chitinophagaceae bacterium]
MKIRIQIAFTAIAISLLFSQCNKRIESAESDDKGYDFSDLSASENLLDSVTILGAIPNKYKLKYTNKSTINSLLYGYLISPEILSKDTLIYRNNQLSKIQSTDIVFGITKEFSNVYENGRLTRLYQYPDNFNEPKRRGLGTYFEYANNQVSRINYKFLNPSLERDSIIFILKYNSTSDLDSVLEVCQRCSPAFNKLQIRFVYGTTRNKLKDNANLQNLALLSYKDLSESYETIKFDFWGITGYQQDLFDYAFMNDFFVYVLFRSQYLPTAFYYNNYPVFIKYKYNKNNYITSISFGNTPNFNQDLNERFQFAYH